MKFKKDFLLNYLSLAPLALALERALECEIFAQLDFQRPILDIGCGEGLFSYILFDEKIDTGIDPNPRELERARQLSGYEELLKCFGDSIPKPDNSFKTIFSNSVLEHIEIIEPVLHEASRLLQPGGHMYITVPSENFNQYTLFNYFLSWLGLKNLSERYRRSYDSFWNHYHAYPLDKWKVVFRNAGFIIEEGFTYNSTRICMLNDLMVGFAIFASINKQITNRWVQFPAIRRIIMAPVYYLLRGQIKKNINIMKGGLIFLSLRKGVNS